MKHRLTVAGYSFTRTIGTYPIRWCGFIHPYSVRLENFGSGARPWRAINTQTGMVMERGQTAKPIVTAIQMKGSSR